MLLFDRDIRSYVNSSRVCLEPWDPQMIQPSSIDVHLDRFFRLFNNHKYPAIDPAADQPEFTRPADVSVEGSLIPCLGEFVLGSIHEKVTFADGIVTRLGGKPSLGWFRLLTHSTAGFIDPGFSGHVTPELSNTAMLPITFYPGMKVGRLCFFQLSSAVEKPYGLGTSGSRHQGQRGPTAPCSHLNFHRIDVGEVLIE